ncbi:MAG: hypothetical protein O2874_02385 [Verrucomicrobia bacterium]|nr:hypothetical protein [Verrucomicrobiota bacterium]
MPEPSGIGLIPSYVNLDRMEQPQKAQVAPSWASVFLANVREVFFQVLQKKEIFYPTGRELPHLVSPVTSQRSKIRFVDYL